MHHKRVRALFTTEYMYNSGEAVDFSLTIVSRGGHVPAVWFEILKDFTNKYCTRASYSFERGGKHEQLHIQGVISCRFPADKMKEFIKVIKNALGVKWGDGSKWYVL